MFGRLFKQDGSKEASNGRYINGNEHLIELRRVTRTVILTDGEIIE